MTGQDALTLLMSRLGNRTEPELRATCLSEMKLVQETRLEQGPIKPWWMTKGLSPALTMTPGSRVVALPADFVMELQEETSFHVTDSAGNSHPLQKRPWDELLNWFGAEANSDLPLDYALIGANLEFFPEPNLALQITGAYYAKQTAPADNSSENNWLKYAADLLIAETGIVMAEMHVQVEDNIVARFQNTVTRAWDRINRENTARAEANMNRRMG